MTNFLDDPTAIIRMVQDVRKFYGSPRSRLSDQGRIRLDFDCSMESPIAVESSEDESPRLKRARLDTILEDAERESAQLSPWQIRLKEKELLETKAQVIQLEIKLRSCKTGQEELRLALENEKETGRRELRCCQEKIDDLQTRLQNANERERRCLPVRDHCTTCTALEKKLLSVEKDRMTIENEWKEKVMDLENKNHYLERQLARTRAEVTTLKDEIEMVKNQEEERKKILDSSLEVAKQNEELKSKLAEAQEEIKKLKFELEDGVIAARLSHLQESRLSKLPAIERENALLKEKNKILSNSLDKLGLYEEQNRDFVAKLKRAEGLQDRVSFLEAQEKDLLRKLEDWQDIMEELTSSSDNPASPRLVLEHVRNLQMSELSLTSRVRGLQSELKAAERQLSSMEEKYKVAKQEASDGKQATENQATLIHRLKKKLFIVSKERDSYRELVDQYEKDLTISVNTTQPMAVAKARTQNHLEVLERNLQNYRDLAKNYESALESVSPLRRNNPSETTGREAEAPSLKEQIEHFRLENERLTREKEVLETQLEHRALKGDYNPLETQVVHFKKNPATVAMSERQGEVERLREENLKLKERVRILQESGAQDDLTQRVSANLQKPGSLREATELREQNKNLEVRMERLKDASRKMSQDMRDAVFHLFGYRLQRTSPGTYRLSSTYAESDSDYLVFQMQGNSAMTLLETPYVATLGELIDLHLNHQRSIPVFLSSITIDLFSKRSYTSSETITID